MYCLFPQYSIKEIWKGILFFNTRLEPEGKRVSSAICWKDQSFVILLTIIWLWLQLTKLFDLAFQFLSRINHYYSPLLQSIRSKAQTSIYCRRIDTISTSLTLAPGHTVRLQISYEEWLTYIPLHNEKKIKYTTTMYYMWRNSTNTTKTKNKIIYMLEYGTFNLVVHI